MRAGVVAAGDEWGFGRSNLCQCCCGIFTPFDSGRIDSWSQNHEIVVHDIAAVDTEALSDKLVLLAPCVNQDDVDVAGLAKLDRLAGADGDHVDLAVVGLLERGKQGGEKT